MMRAAVLTVLVAASSAALAEQARGDVRRGWQVFISKTCVQCHAIWGKGGEIGPDLGRTRAGGLTDSELAAAMWNHVPRMWGKMEEEAIAHVAISESEMADVFAYLAFVKALDEPGNPDIGERLLHEKRCGYCHSLSSKKGIGPDLRRWGRYRNPAVWAKLMLDHAPGMVREMGARGVEAQRLKPDELVDIISYIRSLSPTGEAELLEPGDPVEGERIFREQRCLQCHEVGGQGGRVGPRLGHPGWVNSFTGAAVKVWNGAARMRATMGTMGVRAPVLSPQDVAHVIAYLFAASYAEAPGVPEQGTRLLQEKGCTRCHDAGTGPSLEKFRGRASPVTLAQALWMHGPTMLERMRDLGIRWPSFTGEEVRHLAAALNAP